MSCPDPCSIPALHGAAPRPRLLLALACALLLLAGCIQDAEMKKFKCDNPNDPLPSNNCDTTTIGMGTTTGAGPIVIAMINVARDVATLINTGTLAMDMTGWILENGDSSKFHIFSVFTLGVGGYVNIHTGTATGTPPATDIWDVNAPNWDPTPPNNQAILKNNSLVVVDVCNSSEVNGCWQ